MFTPFLTPNFTFQLQNQIKARFQPNANPHQPSQAQSQFYQYDPFQHQTFQNIPHQMATTQQITNCYETPQQNSFSNSNSFIKSPSNVNHEDESQDFQRKPTFFGSPLFGSDIFMNHIKQQVQNYYEDSPNSKQNPEKSYSYTKNEIHITTIQTFEVPQNKQRAFRITQSQELIKNSVCLSQKLQQQNNEMILEEQTQNENQQISQTERMFEMFDKEELQSKKVETNNQINCFPQTVSQQGPQESFQKQFFQESVVHEIDLAIDQNASKQSFLKQMQSKIKSSKIRFPKNNSSKFSLKQFKQNLKKPKQVLSTPKNHEIQNHELYRAIFELVTKKEPSPRKEPQQMQKIVEKLKISILPHFQKLENDYSQKISQMNQLVQGMILINLKKQSPPVREGNLDKKYERRLYNVNQSTIQINLNDDDMSEQKHGSKGPLQQIEQEREGQKNRLKVSVPMITRTDSMEGLFVSYQSKKSEIDILASVSSKGESKEVMEGDSNNLPDDM